MDGQEFINRIRAAAYGRSEPDPLGPARQRYSRPRLEPGSRTRSTVGQVAPMLPLEAPPSRAQQRAEYDAAQRAATRPRAAPAYQPPSNQFAEAGQYGLEMTGLPSVRRSARAFASGDMQTGVEEGAMGALGVGTLLAGGRGARAPMPDAPPMRAPVAEPGALRPPIRPVQEIGRASDGSVMPVRPPEPFRQSMVGGSDDLAEAARPGALRPARSPSAGARVSELQSRADPFGPVNLWDESQPPITVAEVRRAMQRGRGEARDYTSTDTQGWSREDHINRIATLARDGWADPIDLSGAGGVHDGLHRLAAAIVRGDETIGARTRQGVFGHGDGGGPRQGPRIENANGSWQIVDESGAVLERLPRGRTFRDADAALQRITSRGPSQ